MFSYCRAKLSMTNNANRSGSLTACHALATRASTAQHSGLSRLASLAGSYQQWNSAAITTVDQLQAQAPSCSQTEEELNAECLRIVNREIQKYEEDGLVVVTDGIDLVRFWDVRCCGSLLFCAID